MVFDIQRASDAFMDAGKSCFYSPHPAAVWDPTGQCWVIRVNTPGDLVAMSTELESPIRVDGQRLVIEDM